MSNVKNLKYGLLRYYRESMVNNTKKDSYEKSCAWYNVYNNLINDRERASGRDVDRIDALNFVIRFSVRQIQLLGQDIHKSVVQEHYFRQSVVKVANRAANNPENIKMALKAKLNMSLENYWKACDNIIACALGNAGYNIEDPNFIISLWGQYPGKWTLINNADKAYNELDYWHPIPRDGAIETVGFSGIIDLNLHESGIGAKKVKGTKKEYILPRIAIRIG
jgi:hypothetical protein